MVASASAAAAASGAARQVLQQRALQCSFSSVFHLRRAGMNHEQATFVENMFVGAVGGPLLLLGVAGLWTGLCSKNVGHNHHRHDDDTNNNNIAINNNNKSL